MVGKIVLLILFNPANILKYILQILSIHILKTRRQLTLKVELQLSKKFHFGEIDVHQMESHNHTLIFIQQANSNLAKSIVKVNHILHMVMVDLQLEIHTLLQAIQAFN